MTTRTSRPPTQNSQNPSLPQDALSIQVSLPQMLDLALGTPEVGAVNLNILHNFLHVLLHQMNLRTTKVEYRGDEANRVKAVINASKVGPTVQLHEYSITDSSATTIQRTQGSGAEISADVFTDTVDGQNSEKSGTAEKTAASAPATARRKTGSETDRPNGAPAAKRTKGSKQHIGAGVNGDRQSVIFVEPVLDGVAPTALGFKRLEETIHNLQQRFEALDELANNPEMIERVKNNKTGSLSDMWHVINVNKRLDGCEAAIEKLTTMVQDLIKSDKIEVTGVGTEELGHLGERILEVENQIAYLSGDIANMRNAEGFDDENIRQIDSSRHVSPNTLDETTKTTSGQENEAELARVTVADKSPEVATIVGEANENVAGVVAGQQDSAGKKGSVDSIAKGQTSPAPGQRRSVIGGIDLTALKGDVSMLKSEMSNLQKNVQDLSSNVSNYAEEMRRIPARSSLSEKAHSMSPAVADETESTTDPNAPYNADRPPSEGKKISAAEMSQTTKKTSSRLSVNLGDSRVSKEGRPSSSREKKKSAPAIEETKNAEGLLHELASRVEELEKEMGCVNEKLNSEAMSALGLDGSGGIGDLVSKIQEIQSDMEKMNETASRLMDEKENRETHTNVLIEQIELLKMIKADKEDLEDALADKADAQAVNRKVSHDQFDAACDDLARGLEDAITKLSQQESIWQGALDDVQREIEGKLDKIEISPLKEFVNNRLKLLQEKLKALAEMRRENEAAGTKKMLSDVQCISCDSNVVMRTEEGVHYRAPTLPCTKSMKPYLTYELDQVRRQQRQLPNSRNMIQFEAAMQEMARKSKPLKEELLTKSPRDHLCNRYCGGSHTITTPQQRVMRMGHFLTQWGPEAVQLTEGVIRGNDGQLYRSRAMPGKSDVLRASGDAASPEVPSETPPSPIPQPAGGSQRPSQVSRGRSSLSQPPKRLSARRSSEASKAAAETKIEEGPALPSTPPSAPPGTVVDESDAVPEPPGPTDEVVREPSLMDNRYQEEAGEDNEEEMPTGLDE